jgi:hypothetical protein
MITMLGDKAEIGRWLVNRSPSVFRKVADWRSSRNIHGGRTMRNVIITLATLVAMLVGAQTPQWVHGDREVQQSSCKDKGTC